MHVLLHQRAVRHQSLPHALAEAVAAEIDHLYNSYGVKTYKIIDEMFVLNERHVWRCATS